MRYFILIFLLLSINAHADQSDFTFYDAGRTHEYLISRISSQLSSQYGFKVRPFPIVVASSSRSHLFKEQFDYLKRLDAESLSLIYISALSDEADTHGYHTDVEVAEKLLSGRKFRVIIYAPEGSLLLCSEQVLNDKEIEEIITKYNKRLEQDAR